MYVCACVREIRRKREVGRERERARETERKVSLRERVLIQTCDETPAFWA